MSDTRRVFVEAVMGTTASIHAHGRGACSPRVEAAVEGLSDALRRDERIFSTYRADSDISALRRGADLEDLDPAVAEVWAACLRLREQSGGILDAWWRGWFDPTGFVKGWAIERAARAVLEPLVREGASRDLDAIGVSVGGDMQLFTASWSRWTWRIGIADPARPGNLCAMVEVRDGAVATSGTSERPGHLFDPRSLRPVTGTVGGTVVAESLAIADAWATVAAIAGVNDVDWLRAAPACSGLVTDGNTVRRWVDGVELVPHRIQPAAFS